MIILDKERAIARHGFTPSGIGDTFVQRRRKDSLPHERATQKRIQHTAVADVGAASHPAMLLLA